MFRTVMSELFARQAENDKRAREATAQNARQAVQEVRARRDLLYPPLNREPKEKRG